jgi:site-specific recombinase XerD
MPSALAPVMDAWLSSVRSPNTRRAYRHDLRAWAAWLNERDAEPLTASRAHVDAWAASLERSGKAPSTRARMLSSLGSFYTYAIDEGRRFGLTVTREPTARARRPYVDRTGEGATHHLTADQARAVINAADETGPRAAVVIRLILLLGCGARDVTTARIEDLGDLRTPAGAGHAPPANGRAGRDPRGHAAAAPDSPGRDTEAPGPERARRTLTVTRRGGTRRLVLPPGVARAIGRAAGGRAEGPIVATRNGRRVADSQVFRTVHLAGRAAGLDLTPRALRDACADLAIEAGVPLREVQCLLGHTDPRMPPCSGSDSRHYCETAPGEIAAYLGR